jgi:hypothetical protein
MSVIRHSTTSRPPHPAPRCDDRETPLSSGQDMNRVILIWLTLQEKYFSLEDWTGIIALISPNKSSSA